MDLILGIMYFLKIYVQCKIKYMRVVSVIFVLRTCYLLSYVINNFFYNWTWTKGKKYFQIFLCRKIYTMHKLVLICTPHRIYVCFKSVVLMVYTYGWKWQRKYIILIYTFFTIHLCIKSKNCCSKMFKLIFVMARCLSFTLSGISVLIILSIWSSLLACISAKIIILCCSACISTWARAWIGVSVALNTFCCFAMRRSELFESWRFLISCNFCCTRPWRRSRLWCQYVYKVSWWPVKWFQRESVTNLHSHL